MSAHVVIGQGGQLRCNHCGATHDPFNGQAIELWALSALGKAFTEQHAACEAPKGERCTFCFSLTHAWEQHVNATTKGPHDWWVCGDTGISSQAIWKHMMGAPVSRHDYPRDPSDFGRCFRLLGAPWAATWKTKIGEMAEHGAEWARLVERWPEMEVLFLKEKPSGKAPKLYALMRSLISPESAR